MRGLSFFYEKSRLAEEFKKGFGREGARPPPVSVPFRIRLLSVFSVFPVREGAGGEKRRRKGKKIFGRSDMVDGIKNLYYN